MKLLKGLLIVMANVLACGCEKQTQDDNENSKEAQGVTLNDRC